MPMLLGTQRINSAGHLEIGGCDTVELAHEFGTPLYVMDEELIRRNCAAFRSAFEGRYPRNVICFAGKSFHTMSMCRIVEEEGLNLDVASGGELYVALEAGFPAERINLHGNNKSTDELEMAVRPASATSFWTTSRRLRCSARSPASVTPSSTSWSAPRRASILIRTSSSARARRTPNSDSTSRTATRSRP
jgi:hypothetical protein